MAFEFHLDIQLQFQQQYENARDYIIPFVEPHVTINQNSAIMDIGCGTGGVLKAFAEKGCRCVGVDLASVTIEVANKMLAPEITNGQVQALYQNIYEYDTDQKFDLIVFKDSIEHIPDQKKIIGHVKKYLKPNGKIFFGFPPWYMPFGGHQQIVRKSKLLSLLPYYHLLPRFMYKAILESAGEEKRIVDELLEIKDLGISTYRFENIVEQTNYRIVKRKFYLINPIYQYKFKLKPRAQVKALYPLPYLRDFLSTCAYYLIEPKK